MNKTIKVMGACPDCAVKPGSYHIDGCDVARCTSCGIQRISCDHGNTRTGWGQLWIGVWPGDIEVAMYNLGSLNDVMLGATWSPRYQLWLRGKES